MVGRTKSKPAATLTVHQVVAFNFRRAREERGWTQTQTGEALEPFIGHRLNQAGVSAIEKTFDSDRRRNIDVAEVMAFARCFDKPVGWFFLPPDTHGDDLIEPVYKGGAGESYNLPAAMLVMHAIGSTAGWRSVAQRIDELLSTRDFSMRDAIEFTLQSRHEDVEHQINLRRNTLMQVSLGRRMTPEDEAVTTLAKALVDLVKLTPIGYEALRDADLPRALELLADGDRLVQRFIPKAEAKRARGEPPEGGYDRLTRIDPRGALGLDDEQE